MAANFARLPNSLLKILVALKKSPAFGGSGAAGASKRASGASPNLRQRSVLRQVVKDDAEAPGAVERRIRRSVRSGIGRRLLWRYAPAALLYVILGSVLLEAARRIVLEGDAPPSPFSVVLLAVAILCPLIIFSTRQMVALAVSLEMAQLELLGVVSHAIAKRDDATEEHNFRVALMAAQLAGAIGLDRRLIPGLFVGALLHDVGKIGVPDNILLKPAGLSPEERREMELHVVHGDGILADANMPPGARGVVHYHHEHFDGSGYPEGRKGGEIPPEARLFAIVDVFDAMTSSRPYKQPMDLNEALEAMERGRGSHFDPAYFDIFAKIAGSLYAMVRNARVDDLQERILRLIENYYATLDPRRC